MWWGFSFSTASSPSSWLSSEFEKGSGRREYGSFPRHHATASIPRCRRGLWIPFLGEGEACVLTGLALSHMPVTGPLWSRVIEVEPARQTPGCRPEGHRGKRTVTAWMSVRWCPGRCARDTRLHLFPLSSEGRTPLVEKVKEQGLEQKVRNPERKTSDSREREGRGSTARETRWLWGPRAERGVGIGSGAPRLLAASCSASS